MATLIHKIFDPVGVPAPDVSDPDTRMLTRYAPSPVVLRARNTPKCYPPRQVRDLKYLLSAVESSTMSRPSLGYEQAIALLTYGGYRISEVLSLRWSDVLTGDRVVVRAAKRGRTSIAHVEGISDYLLQVPPLNRDDLIFRCSYGQVYRKMLQRGYAVQPSGHINRSVTHSPRRALAVSAAAHYSLAVASDLLHHKSTTAIAYYVQPGSCDWTLDYLAGWFYIRPHYSLFVSPKWPWVCHTGWLLTCDTFAGYHNGGGHYSSHPDNSDPCVVPQIPWMQEVTFANLGSGIWPVNAMLTIWYGEGKQIFGKQFTTG